MADYSYVDPVSKWPWWKKALMVGLGAAGGPGVAHGIENMRRNSMEDSWRNYESQLQAERQAAQDRRDTEQERRDVAREDMATKQFEMMKQAHEMTQANQRVNILERADSGASYTPPPTMIGNIPSQSAEEPGLGNPPVNVPGLGEVRVKSASEREYTRRQEKASDEAKRASERMLDMQERARLAQETAAMNRENNIPADVRAWNTPEGRKAMTEMWNTRNAIQDKSTDKARGIQANNIDKLYDNDLQALRKEVQKRNAPSRNIIGERVDPVDPMKEEDIQARMAEIKAKRDAARGNLGLQPVDESKVPMSVGAPQTSAPLSLAPSHSQTPPSPPPNFAPSPAQPPVSGQKVPMSVTPPPAAQGEWARDAQGRVVHKVNGQWILVNLQ